jgi:hypothetical protein
MRKNTPYRFSIAILASFLSLIAIGNVYGQSDRVLKVAVFSPLYLDSVFTKNMNYKSGKKFPRFTLPGFELSQGASAAASLFPIQGKTVITRLFDTKSDSITIDDIIKQEDFSQYHLIIASVKEQELLSLSALSKSLQIPLISVTYPNNAGITDNPFLVLLNSTLQTHCEALFSYVLQNHSASKIILANQTGSQEDRVAGYFNQINTQHSKKLIQIQTQKLDSNYFLIKNALDSNKTNVIICGSLDENFATQLAVALNPLKDKYEFLLLGMPNWESFKAFNSKSGSNKINFPVYYTSPYYNDKSDTVSQQILDYYLEKFKGVPTEMFFKGFEAMYVFSRLIHQFPDGLNKISSDPELSLFSSFNLMPKQFPLQNQPGYYENKHLFFIRKQNGQTSKAW